MHLSSSAALRSILKTTAWLGTALALSALSACGGGDTVASGGSGGNSPPLTSSSITLPTTVQVVSAH